MATNLPTDIINARALSPYTEARLTALEADTTHLRELDGQGARAYLDAVSEAMDCGPYTASETTALSDIQRMLVELDIEKAALRLGLFVRGPAKFIGRLEGLCDKDEYTEQIQRADAMLEMMKDAAERDRIEIERLKTELEEVREELERERQKTSEEEGNNEKKIDEVEEVQKHLQSTAIVGKA